MPPSDNPASMNLRGLAATTRAAICSIELSVVMFATWMRNRSLSERICGANSRLSHSDPGMSMRVFIRASGCAQRTPTVDRDDGAIGEAKGGDDG